MSLASGPGSISERDPHNSEPSSLRVQNASSHGGGSTSYSGRQRPPTRCTSGSAKARARPASQLGCATTSSSRYARMSPLARRTASCRPLWSPTAGTAAYLTSAPAPRPSSVTASRSCGSQPLSRMSTSEGTSRNCATTLRSASSTQAGRPSVGIATVIICRGTEPLRLATYLTAGRRRSRRTRLPVKRRIRAAPRRGQLRGRAAVPADTVLEHARMHQVEHGPMGSRGQFEEVRALAKFSIAHEDKHVLRIPPLNRSVRPDEGT